jgi:hypothetical protein
MSLENGVGEIGGKEKFTFTGCSSEETENNVEVEKERK